MSPERPGRATIVAEIQEMMAAGKWVTGESTRELAVRYGLTASTIRHHAAEASRRQRTPEGSDLIEQKKEAIFRLREIAEEAMGRVDHPKLGASFLKVANEATVRAAEIEGVPLRHSTAASQLAEERDRLATKLAAVLCPDCRAQVLKAFAGEVDDEHEELAS